MSWGEKKTKRVVSKGIWRGETGGLLFYFCLNSSVTSVTATLILQSLFISLCLR